MKLIEAVIKPFKLDEVKDALNAIGIEPVLLKGAAHLVGGVYPAPSLRVVGDLDVLVPEERVKTAAETLHTRP